MSSEIKAALAEYQRQVQQSINHGHFNVDGNPYVGVALDVLKEAVITEAILKTTYVVEY